MKKGAKAAEGNPIRAGSAPRMGLVLFDSVECDWALFQGNLSREWEIRAAGSPIRNSMVFHAGGFVAACGFIPSPVPNREVEKKAVLNTQWPQARQAAQRHQAHMILTVMNGPDALLRSIVFCKAACALLCLPNATALYQPPTLWPPQQYISEAGKLRTGGLPVLDWVFTGCYETPWGRGAYTQGLSYFGFDELEIVHSEASEKELRAFLEQAAAYVLKTGAVLRTGQTIGCTGQERLPMERGPGVAVEGKSIKIRFRPGEKAPARGKRI